MRKAEVYRNGVLAGILTEENRKSYVFRYDAAYFSDKDKPAIDMEYLLQSFHDKMYYIHKVTRNFKYDNLATWVQHKMVYVSRNNNFLTRNKDKLEIKKAKENITPVKTEPKGMDF